jgi:hypothetical protein
LKVDDIRIYSVKVGDNLRPQVSEEGLQDILSFIIALLEGLKLELNITLELDDALIDDGSVSRDQEYCLNVA